MANMIQQLDLLRGLPDDALKAELSQPSGSVPPFLVASEVNRREDMRKRYEGEVARRAPKTSVIDDLLAQRAGTGAFADPQTASSGAPIPPVGIGAAMGRPPLPTGATAGGVPGMVPQQPHSPMAPQGAAPGQVPGFSNGGVVPGYASGGIAGALDLNALAQKYTDKLSSLEEDRNDAIYLAMIQAGAAMASGKGSTLGNIGTGLGAFGEGYTAANKQLDEEELAALGSLTELTNMQSQHEDARERIALQQKELEERRALAEEARQHDIDMEALRDKNSEKDPAAVRTSLWYEQATPEQREIFDKLNPPYNPNALTNDLRVDAEINELFRRNYESQVGTIDGSIDPIKAKRDAAILTYQQIKGTYGPERAARFAQSMGLNPGDLAVIDAPAAGAPAAPATAPDGTPILSFEQFVRQ